MGYDSCVRIERMANGFSVTIKDPAIVEANAKPDGRYRDPEREYAFDDLEKLKAFLDKTLEKALPMPKSDSFDVAFDKAAADKD